MCSRLHRAYACGPRCRAHVPVSVLYPGADVERFHPDLRPSRPPRARTGVGDRPLVVCVSRLVAAQGAGHVDPARCRRSARASRTPTLLIVGGGPYEDRLRSLRRRGARDAVVFAGQVAEEDLPRYYAVGDVFAMPCRTRLGGPRGRGLGQRVHRGGGVRRGRSWSATPAARARRWSTARPGLLVDGAGRRAVADAVADLLADPARAPAMGAAGRARVLRDHTWPRSRRGSRPGCRGGRAELSFVPRRWDRGYPPGVSADERRCPNCGALVAADADWCGQCFTEPARAGPAARAAERRAGDGRAPRSRRATRVAGAGAGRRVLAVPRLRRPEPDRAGGLRDRAAPRSPRDARRRRAARSTRRRRSRVR